MASIEEIRNERLKKLSILKDNGISAYPIKSSYDATLEEAINNFSKLSKKKKGVTLVGRIMALRGQGAIIFFNIFDGTGTFQGLLKKDEIDDKDFELFTSTTDIGDFIEVTGPLFVTKRKEKTILVRNWKMLSKSLRSLPDKWHGLQDVEERFRRRYLDTLMSKEVRDVFVMRSKVVSAIRSFLDAEGYLEVETPVLQPIAGGTNAEPFKTHHNALDIDLYLRIAPELYLKRLLVGGFNKVYEIGRNFRNEGIDVTHNPEFTMLEYYEAYSDCAKQMALTENLIKSVVKKIFKKTSVEHNDVKIDFSKKFTTISYVDLLKRYALISNPLEVKVEELRSKAQQLAVETKPSDPKEKILDNIYKKICRPKLIQPTFVVDYPVNMLPLAKTTDKNKNLVDAFQIVIGGVEFVKGFSELNDPVDQGERFAEQEKNRKAGDKEAQENDLDYLEAMEYGMPPAGGVGIGIDRLVMLLTNTKNIKEVLFFPTMKPRSE